MKVQPVLMNNTEDKIHVNKPLNENINFDEQKYVIAIAEPHTRNEITPGKHRTLNKLMRRIYTRT